MKSLILITIFARCAFAGCLSMNNEINKDPGLEVMEALEIGDEDKAIRLIEEGANLNVTNKLRYNPLYAALYYGYYNVAQLIINKGYKYQINIEYTKHIFLERFSNTSILRILKLLIKNGLDVNLRGYYGGTLLHSASSRGNANIINLLIDAGADVCAISNMNYTPLDWLVDEDHLNMIPLYIDKCLNECNGKNRSEMVTKERLPCTRRSDTRKKLRDMYYCLHKQRNVDGVYPYDEASWDKTLDIAVRDNEWENFIALVRQCPPFFSLFNEPCTQNHGSREILRNIYHSLSKLHQKGEI